MVWAKKKKKNLLLRTFLAISVWGWSCSQPDVDLSDNCIWRRQPEKKSNSQKKGYPGRSNIFKWFNTHLWTETKALMKIPQTTTTAKNTFFQAIPNKWLKIIFSQGMKKERGPDGSTEFKLLCSTICGGQPFIWKTPLNWLGCLLFMKVEVS